MFTPDKVACKRLFEKIMESHFSHTCDNSSKDTKRLFLVNVNLAFKTTATSTVYKINSMFKKMRAQSYTFQFYSSAGGSGVSP